jgi:Holliday junction DNA helicase RuvA
LIYCLTGEILYIDALSNSAVIDCAGVGYKLTVTGSTLSYLSACPKNEKVRVFTYMAVREDAVELFGFRSPEELSTFKILISVSGVGPKAAIAILTVLSPEALAMAISSGDVKAICAAQGVGKRIAERIVLELKDKLAKNLPDFDTGSAATPAVSAAKGSMADARDALLVLGYTRGEVEAALKGVDKNMETEDIIRSALGRLMK